MEEGPTKVWRILSQYTRPDRQTRSKNAHPCQRKEIIFKSWTMVIKAGASVRQAIYSEICKHRMVPHLSLQVPPLHLMLTISDPFMKCRIWHTHWGSGVIIFCYLWPRSTPLLNFSLVFFLPLLLSCNLFLGSSIIDTKFELQWQLLKRNPYICSNSNTPNLINIYKLSLEKNTHG